jgi:Rad52/22 family double-strand break repair protein
MTEPRDTVIEEILQAKFDPAELKRNQEGLTYVEDETVMDRLDFALGFGSWGTFTQAISDRSVIVGLKVRDPRTGQWSEFADYGYCTNPGTHEALKEAWTDGFRRVARQAGVARYVYAGEAEAPAAPTVPAGPIRQIVQPQPVPQNAPVPQGVEQGVCPVHQRPWREGQYGPYCTAKAGTGEAANKNGYCNLRP